MNTKPPAGRRLRWLARGVVVLLLVAVYLGREAWLPLIPRGIVVSEPPAASGKFLIIGGDAWGDHVKGIEGVPGAVEFLHLRQPPGRLQRLGVFPDSEELIQRELDKSGWPRESLTIIETDSRTEDDVLRALGQYLSAWPEVRLDVLCPRYASRRFRLAVDRTIPDYQARVAIVPVPDSRFQDQNWWRSRTGAKVLASGYCELLFEMFVGAEADMGPEWDPDEYATGLTSP